MHVVMLKEHFDLTIVTLFKFKYRDDTVGKLSSRVYLNKTA